LFLVEADVLSGFYERQSKPRCQNNDDVRGNLLSKEFPGNGPLVDAAQTDTSWSMLMSQKCGGIGVASGSFEKQCRSRYRTKPKFGLIT
jgi:hypothetical protein